jgi:uncharacterized membrane protein
MLYQLLLVLNAPETFLKYQTVNAILVSIGLTMVITTIILFSKPFLPFVLAAITVIPFVSLLSILESLVSFFLLLAMVIALHQKRNSV